MKQGSTIVRGTRLLLLYRKEIRRAEVRALREALQRQTVAWDRQGRPKAMG